MLTRLYRLTIIFFLTLVTLPGITQTLQQDSLALADFYNATGGSSGWSKKTNWLTSRVGNWYGVTVANGRVTGINLNSNNISGNVPTTFGNLTALTSLSLHNNAISSIDISLMPMLTYVAVSWNPLTTFNTNSSDRYYLYLNTLNLQYNRLTTADLRGMPALKTCNLTGATTSITTLLTNSRHNYYYQLTDLYMDNNKIQSLDISGMPALKYLDIHYNTISQIITADSINYYGQLATLYAYGNSLASLDISNMPALVTCNAANNLMTQFTTNPSNRYYPNFKELYLQGNKLNATLNIFGMPALVSFYAYNNSLTQLITNPEDRYYPNLLEVQLVNNKLGGTLNLSNMPALTSVQAYNNLLTAITFNGGTEYYPGLTYINIGNNQISSLELKGMKNLNNLYCFTNNLITLDLSQQKDLGGFWAYSNQLTQIIFHPNADVIDIAVQNNKLTSMDISGMHSLARLQAYNNLLINLTTTGSTIFPNLTFLHLANNQLTSLDVKGMPGLTTLACNLNKLTSLDLSKQKSLKDFYAYSNEFSTITFHPEVNLETVQLFNNKLTSLDISGMYGLSSVQAYNNLLTSITLNSNPGFYSNLTYLHLANNQLTSVDLRGMPKLTTIGLFGNKLSSLDLTAQIDLTSLYVYNNNLSFEDLEPLAARTFTTYLYSPQSLVKLNFIDPQFFFEEESAHNIYQWKKNGIAIPGATNSVLTITDIAYEANDQYQCIITNSVVTGLTLYSQIKRPKDFTSIPSIPANPTNDFDKNWTYSKVYDEAGNVIGESKSFSDNLGRSTQIQGKTFSTGHILASQTVYDENGGAVLSTLSAPINNSEFSYKENFINGRDRTILVKTTSGQIIKLPDGTVYKSPSGEVYKTVKGEAYRYTDFKKKLPNGEVVTNPDPVANHEQGSVGWYYSNNNSSEPYVAPTDYPFSLVEEYELAPGEAKKVSGPGDEHKMGLGKEGKGKSMPLLQELNHYLSLRHHFVDGAVPASMYLQGMKSVSIDANGVESISFTDKSGQLLASCLSGSQYAGINVNAVIGAGSDNNYLDLHIPETGSTTHLTLTGSGNSNGEISIKIIDLINNSTVYEGGSGAADLPKGFYRAIIFAGEFNISYLLRYGNFSYSYYDDAGRPVATVAPKGVVMGNTDYPKFVSTLQYNTLGQLLSGTDPDAGASELVYRKDGSLRFSQNAQQKIDHKFSFVNYDRLGRTLRAGEYQMLAGAGQVFENHLTAIPAANSVLQPAILEDKTRTGGLDEARIISKTDSWYDRPFTDPELGLRIQEFVLGKAAKTRNENSTSWYSYDERGRLMWMVQKIEGLGTQAKTIDYKYDAAGNVTEVAYQQGQADAFYHYYQYDKDQRLSKVFTSRDGTIKSLQARYTYYVHGPLKRVVLADNLQGMDYIYTVQGWLKSINHPESDKDPGKDGSNGVAPDAFGMTLDYFNGDYTRAGTNISSLDLGAEYAPQFGGSIRAMSWKTKKPTSVVAEAGPQIENPTTYAFKYDAKYQLKEATWGTPDFANKTFTSSALFKEQVPEYDVHGNIISLIRNNKDGAIADNFSYNYITNTNKLLSVTGYSSYKYDAIGQMTEETKGSSTVYLDYDESGNVTKVYTDAAKTQLKVSFFYDDGAQRVKKITHSNNVTTYYVRDASGNILASYDNNGTPQISVKEFPIYAGGRIGQYYAVDNTMAYELTDHLGNVRALIKRTRKTDGTADVIDYSDYFPFGSIARGTNTFHYKFGYQGQFAVKDEETDWNSFELRMYDAKIGRWLSTDPYGEFWSPYVGMGNDPVNLVDPDGGCTKCPKPVFSASYGNFEIVIEGISKGAKIATSFGMAYTMGILNLLTPQNSSYMNGVVNGLNTRITWGFIPPIDPKTQPYPYYFAKGQNDSDLAYLGMSLVSSGSRINTGGAPSMAISPNGTTLTVPNVVPAPAPALQPNKVYNLEAKGAKGFPKIFDETLAKIKSGQGVPRIDPSTGKQTIFRGDKLTGRQKWKWSGSKEWDIPGTGHRILEKVNPDGTSSYGRVVNHDYRNIYPF